MKEAFISLFMERLRIVDDLKRYPEIRDIQIPAPIFIVGLPRTGSTLLHSCMLPIYPSFALLLPSTRSTCSRSKLASAFAVGNGTPVSFAFDSGSAPRKSRSKSKLGHC